MPKYLREGFASKEEYNKFHKKIIRKKYYPLSRKNYFKKRHQKEILERGKNRCEKCGNKKSLVIHHLDKNTKNNSMKNLLLLCRVA